MATSSTVPKTAVYDFCIKGPGSFDGKASGAIIKGKIELNLDDQLHIGIGQIGDHYASGSGGTFIAKKVGNEFIPLLVAGGAAGTDVNISQDDMMMANAKIDEFGGNSSMNNAINEEKGSSGTCRYSTAHTAGAGFYSSPSLDNLVKVTVID